MDTQLIELAIDYTTSSYSKQERVGGVILKIPARAINEASSEIRKLIEITFQATAGDADRIEVAAQVRRCKEKLSHPEDMTHVKSEIISAINILSKHLEQATKQFEEWSTVVN